MWRITRHCGVSYRSRCRIKCVCTASRHCFCPTLTPARQRHTPLLRPSKCALLRGTDSGSYPIPPPGPCSPLSFDEIPTHAETSARVKTAQTAAPCAGVLGYNPAARAIGPGVTLGFSLRAVIVQKKRSPDSELRERQQPGMVADLRPIRGRSAGGSSCRLGCSSPPTARSAKVIVRFAAALAQAWAGSLGPVSGVPLRQWPEPSCHTFLHVAKACDKI